MDQRFHHYYLVMGHSLPYLAYDAIYCSFNTTTKILQLQFTPCPMVTEEAFGQLKGRWRILLRKCESKAENVKVFAICVFVVKMSNQGSGILPKPHLPIKKGMHLKFLSFCNGKLQKGSR